VLVDYVVMHCASNKLRRIEHVYKDLVISRLISVKADSAKPPLLSGGSFEWLIRETIYNNNGLNS
jgi:hypothetical protein